MIEEVAANIYRIGVPLPNNPLRELNSYFIRGTDHDLLIDTGFRNEECRAALEEGLRELHSDPERRDVLITHLHSDHSGMADLFVGNKRHIYISDTDMKYLGYFLYEPDYRYRQRSRYVREGLPADLEAAIFKVNPANQQTIKELTDQYAPLQEGDIIRVGDYSLRTILVPGHTPGNSVFWCEKQGILFCGDHVLFDISPNITVWDKVEDSLGNYLDNLERVRALPVKLALPGHRKTGDFAARVEALLEHYHRRLDEVQRILRENPGLTAYEITSRMTWRIRARNWEEFPITQKWFATGECLSHLDYLRKRGIVFREEKNGRLRYFLAE